jgi:hypothetical protein
MCRLVERVYINADGHRSKFEDSFPCDKARNGKLCSKAKKRTTEYHTKRDSIPPRGDTPSPVNPPTPTGTGTYLVQQRRPSLSGGRPSTRDGQKSIIIDFGPKSYKSKKYTLGSNKHLSIGATYDDIAVESPGSDASHTIRTGLPEAPLPPQASYDHSDTYSTASNVSHGYYHRHTSSTSTYPESSRIPSLYVTSDTDYDFPTNTRSTKLPPTIHYPSNVSAPSSPGQSRTHGGTTSANHNLTVVTPGYIQEPPLPNTLSALDYQDYADRSGSSHASSGSASQTGRGQASDQPRKKEDGKGRQQEFEAENIKQVRFELRRAEIQTKEQMETLLAEREKQRAAERDEIRRHKEKERKQRERPEEAAAKSRKKERLLPAISNSRFKRTAGSHRESVTMTPAQQDEQRRLLAAELDQIQGESRAAEVREHEEKKAFLQQQQQDPSYYNPRMGGLLGSTALTRRDSQLRRGSISSDARPMLVQSNSRRTSISQPNPSAISTKVAQGLMQPSTRAHAPPPLSFPSNFNTRPTVARRSSFSSQDLPFTTSARSSATNIGNPFAKAASGMLVNSDPWNARNLREALPKEPNLGSGSDKTPSLSSSKKIKSGKESRMGPVLDDSTAPDSKPGVLPRLEVRLRHESGAHDHAQSSKDVPVSTEPIIIPQSPIEIYGHARSRLGDLGTTDDSFQIGRLSELEVGKDATCERRPNSCSSTDATGLLPESVFDASVADPLDTSSDLVVRASQMCNAENWTEQPKVMEPISEDKKSLVLLPTVKSTQASSAHLAAGLKVRADFAIPDGSIADFTETEKSPTSSAGSDGSSYEAFEDCEVHVDDALSSAMGVVKHLLLRELLDHTLLDATDAFGGTNTFTSDGTGSSTSRSFASSSVSSQTPAKGKRSRGDGRNPSDGDGDGNGDGDHSDDEDDGRPKKRGGRGFPDRFPQRRLKCPFYQRHPDKYTKAACRGSGFVDMAKLKDHIKRVHTQPLRCSRCWLEMESDDAYSEHLQQESICKKATEPLEDRIRPQLLKRLEFKKAPYSNAHNVGEKWKMLYKVLFPSDDVIPSPCKCDINTRDFHITDRHRRTTRHEPTARTCSVRGSRGRIDSRACTRHRTDHDQD